MTNNLKKWLAKAGVEFETNVSVEGKPILFVKSAYAQKVSGYLQKHYKLPYKQSYAASYEWLQVILG